MRNALISKLSTIMLVMAAGILGGVLSRVTMVSPKDAPNTVPNNPGLVQQTDSPTHTPVETIPPSTPLATLTPSSTLRPPPTFEPATPTYTPTTVPTATPTPTTQINVSIPGLNGLETPTPTTTPGCTPDPDWQLVYEVKEGDALASIAEKYNTTMFDLAEGNCLRDMNLIRVGQHLRVPGEAPPVASEVECIPYEVLTPLNGALTIPAAGQLTFNWRGPRAPLNLIRVYTPSGQLKEYIVELRQNETINLVEELPEGGTYTWYVFPLNRGYQQVCPNGGPWTFTKEALN